MSQTWSTSDESTDYATVDCSTGDFTSGNLPRYADDDSQRMTGFIIMAGSALVSLAIACIAWTNLAG